MSEAGAKSTTKWQNDKCLSGDSQESTVQTQQLDNRAKMVVETGFTYTGDPKVLADAIDNTFQGLSIEHIKIAKFLSLLPKKYQQPVAKFCHGEKYDSFVACASALHETQRNMSTKQDHKVKMCGFTSGYAAGSSADAKKSKARASYTNHNKEHPKTRLPSLSRMGT